MTDAFKLATWKERGGEYVRRLARDLNLTLEQAAGLVGNLGFESAGFKAMQEIAPLAGGRGGFGVAQWTGPRRLAFERWASENGLFPASDEANYGYLLHELQGDYKSTVAALRKTHTVQDAVFSVGQTYERPGGTTDTHLPGYDGRLNYARQALAGAKVPVTPEPASDAPSAINKIKAMQLVLGVEQDGDFGKISRAALNDILTAAAQPPL